MCAPARAATRVRPYDYFDNYSWAMTLSASFLHKSLVILQFRKSPDSRQNMLYF
jgi:hypothetical protein